MVIAQVGSCAATHQRDEGVQATKLQRTKDLFQARGARQLTAPHLSRFTMHTSLCIFGLR